MDSFLTTSEAYLAALAALLDRPDWTVGPRGMATRELMNWQLVVERPTSSLVVTASAARNATIARYCETERGLYLAGERSAEVWAERASKFWLGLANPDGTVNSNYGELMMVRRDMPGGLTAWEWARESLVADPDTRQAFVRVSRPEHQWRGNRDQVCTMHLHFMLRGGRLHATAVMRSCDAVKGLAYDAPWFCWCLEVMATSLAVPVGTYAHLAHSLHLYERDVALAERMLGRSQ